MFADDTQIETAGYDVNTIVEELNQDLENVSVWLSANKLTLNKTKTEYMIIGSNRRVNHINITPNIFIKDREINRVKTTKSLGIMIDETLSWNAQVDQITKKVNSGLSILKRLRDILDYQTLIKIYLSIIQPHFDYCSQIWGCLGKVLSDKLQKLQNRAFRIITRENYDTRTIDVLNKVGLPNLVTRRKHHLAVLMFKAKHNMLPNCLTELFTTSNEIHNYNTRQSEFNFALPKPKTNFMKKSFAYRGAETWNNLSADIKSKTSISTFKNSLTASV